MPENNPEIRLRNEASLPLFDRAYARKNDPQTSHDASRSVTNLGPTRDRIINILYSYGPLTDEQIWKRYAQAYETTLLRKESPSGMRSRRCELVRYGLVEACGISKTSAGRNCQVWRLKK